MILSSCAGPSDNPAQQRSHQTGSTTPQISMIKKILSANPPARAFKGHKKYPRRCDPDRGPDQKTGNQKPYTAEEIAASEVLSRELELELQASRAEVFSTLQTLKEAQGRFQDQFQRLQGAMEKKLLKRA